MGYESGVIKYFFGMVTSLWGLIAAYLFAEGLLNPLDYIQAVVVVIENLANPKETLLGLAGIFITTPGDMAQTVLFGLVILTILWYFGSKFS